MSVVIVKGKVTPEDLKIAQEEYGDFVKIVVDIETRDIAIGGEWHADGEKVLLENGSKQKNLWGGGIRLESKKIDFNSLINTRPSFNASQEILDQTVRDIFVDIVKEKFQI